LTEPLSEKPAETATVDGAGAAPETAGKLERRPTHGLTPAGLSMRFDKPREAVPEEEHEAEHDGANEDVAASSRVAPAVRSPALADGGDAEMDTDDVHILHAHDVLSGNVSRDKLDALAKLDDHQYDSTEPHTPAGSRRPSEVDLASEVQTGLDRMQIEEDEKQA
jgi:hypothetical protein